MANSRRIELSADFMAGLAYNAVLKHRRVERQVREPPPS
jgi:hypothetical protein